MYIKKHVEKFLEKRRKRNQSVAYEIKKNNSAGKNIIFIMPTNKNQKSGGDKVIYRQSQIINESSMNGFSSQVLHPFDPGSFLDWFEHDVDVKQDLRFDPERDLVVVPEIWAAPHGNLLAKLGVKYAIYVQGGYIINTPLYLWSLKDLMASYHGASLIIGISEDTVENIQLLFPELKDKVIRNFYSVNREKFSQQKKKEPLITFMPRRLARHSELVRFFIEPILPKGWKLLPVEGLSEQGVADLLARSSIFMSFSELEGCPLPPVEAAMSGNHVVGYTGQGGKEYWDADIFTEINNGDIKTFCNVVLEKIKQIEANEVDWEAFSHARELLAKRYSAEAEIQSLKEMTEKMDGLTS